MFLALYFQSPLNTSLYTIHPLRYLTSWILYIILAWTYQCSCSVNVHCFLFINTIVFEYIFCNLNRKYLIIYQNNSFCLTWIIADISAVDYYTESAVFAAVFLHFTALWDLVSKGQNRLMSGVWGRSSEFSSARFCSAVLPAFPADWLIWSSAARA